VSSRESRVWVTRVTGQLTDGSRGSWVISCDPLSALLPRRRHNQRCITLTKQNSDLRRLLTTLTTLSLTTNVRAN